MGASSKGKEHLNTVAGFPGSSEIAKSRPNDESRCPAPLSLTPAEEGFEANRSELGADFLGNGGYGIGVASLYAPVEL